MADTPSRAGSETILIMPALLVARFCTGLFLASARADDGLLQDVFTDDTRSIFSSAAAALFSMTLYTAPRRSSLSWRLISFITATSIGLPRLD